MGRLGDYLDIWELEIAKRLKDVVTDDGSGEALVDADEVAFFGSMRTLPPSMDYLREIGTPVIDAEVYIIGIKDGQLIGPEIWFGQDMRPRLEDLGIAMQQKMSDMMEVVDEEGFGAPTMVKIAVKTSTGKTVAKYDFDPLPAPPAQGMTKADWAFDVWAGQIVDAGGAIAQIEASKEEN
jgi:hypothetical protein